MRANSKFGVLSDQYIKDNYADCFLPVSVDKLHSIRQKPAESYVNTSGKRVKEYNSIAPVIPQFISENQIKQSGVAGQQEKNSIKSDLIRKAAAAKSDYSILQPTRKRQGALQEDLGFAQISSMANAQDPNYGKFDSEFIAEELNDQAPLGAYGDKANFNTILGMNATRAKEDMTFAGKGVKPDLAEIIDPSVKNKIYIATELQRQPESALFVKAMKPQGPQAPTQAPTQAPMAGPVDLMPKDQITDVAQTMQGPQAPPAPQALPGTSQPVLGTQIPEPPATPVAQSTATTLSGSSVTIVNNAPLIYKDINEAQSIVSKREVPDVSIPEKSTVSILANFLARNLTLDGGNKAELMKFLKGKPRTALKKITQKYFPKPKGSPVKLKIKK